MLLARQDDLPRVLYVARCGTVHGWQASFVGASHRAPTPLFRLPRRRRQGEDFHRGPLTIRVTYTNALELGILTLVN